MNGRHRVPMEPLADATAAALAEIAGRDPLSAQELIDWARGQMARLGLTDHWDTLRRSVQAMQRNSAGGTDSFEAGVDFAFQLVLDEMTTIERAGQ